MKNIKTILIFCSLTLLFSCTKDFDEANTDPNKLSEMTAGSNLNPVIYKIAKRNAVQMRSITAPVTQMFVASEDFTNAPHFYDFNENIGAGTWNDYYNVLNNIREMHLAAERDNLDNYKAIALTLRAYALSVLTDCFGDVPAAEASLGEEGTWFPTFTPQKDIYSQIFLDLEEANALYNHEEGMVYVEDILFHNKSKLWQKFTNSLHLRLLLRVSNRTEVGAFSKMQNMLENPTTYPIFTDRDEEATLHLDGIAPLMSPWDRPQDFGTFRYYTAFFIDNLNDFEDPRLPVFAGEAREYSEEGEGDYLGYIGLPIDFVNTPLPDTIATPSGVKNSLATAPLKIPILTYAEVEFMKAELAQRGYFSDAEMHYKNAVTSAIEFWEIEMPETYFDTPFTAYNGSLEQILLQKYYALFFTDYQAWFEMRRTGLPQLPTTSEMLNNQELPTRMYYPINEIDRNFNSYKEAVERMGGDEINKKVWWDIQS